MKVGTDSQGLKGNVVEFLVWTQLFTQRLEYFQAHLMNQVDKQLSKVHLSE